MNVFEDLVEELKEENLLEETVIENNAAEARAQEARNSAFDVVSPMNETYLSDRSRSDFDFAEPVAETPNLTDGEISDEFKVVSDLFDAPSESFDKPQTLSEEMEFYRRRAVDEVTSLQIVEHVFSGVEREQMKILPKPFNDIAVKKALHDFLQVSKNSPANENAQAEFKLMQETESWCSALSHRDKHLSVSALRRYCETTKPSLSAQALIALARFYRNLPNSEPIRSKFDMVMTRLFTKEIEHERRELLFERDELVNQINELYADWASVSLFSVEEETELMLITVKFDDFLAEAQGAENFDELVKNDFYNRLRLFKESLGDRFYASVVLASAIESNVLIGNRYVELVEKERHHSSSEKIESQYSFLLDQAISDATSKTLQLVELLKERTAAPAKVDETKETLNVPQTKIEYKEPQQSRNGFFGVSPWLAAVLVVVIGLSAALYVYVEYLSPQKVSPNVQKVNIDNSVFKDYLAAARINQETIIGVVTPAWDGINEEKKQEILGNLLSIGKEKGFKTVYLLNSEGLSVGYASESEIKVTNP